MRSIAIIEQMDRQDCELMLSQMPIGRIGINFGGKPVVLPVNYVFVDGEILFRTFTGQKFHAAKARQDVCFEVDAWDLDLRTGWSVLVKGHAEPILETAKIAAAEELGLDSWTDIADHGPWVRIIPDEITGRRLV
ncbi:MAG: pyridoxamine 5'-phosphate oxidase family protein [Acidimicrobiales bacterium]